MSTPSPADVAAQQAGKRNGTRMLDAAREIRADADRLLTLDLDGIDPETCIRIAHELKMARQAVGATEEFVAKQAAHAWPTKWEQPIVVEGVGTAHPYRTRGSVTWDHEGLVKATVEQHMAETGGDLSDPYGIVRAVTDAAAINYWRVGVLKKRDIDPNDYRSSNPGSLRLDIRSDDEIGATTKPEVTS